jgi:hypothetical protein
VVPKTLALTGNDGRQLHEDQYLPPAGPMRRQPQPEDPVTEAHTRPPYRAFMGGELMPERQDLHF